MPNDMRDTRSLGIYQKYIVARTDREDGEGHKHYDCQYFVLDLDHDRHAKAAIAAYAVSCALEFPALAEDLDALLVQCKFQE